jgi:hypothetical protein
LLHTPPVIPQATSTESSQGVSNVQNLDS